MDDSPRVERSNVSNRGRWGPDDDRGTANLITVTSVLRAARCVRSGTVVSLSHDLDRERIQHRVLFTGLEPEVAADVITVAPHSLGLTHLDAPMHIFHDGEAYNGRHPGEVLRRDGLSAGSIMAFAEGLVTRAVFLDVARAMGEESLQEGVAVTGDMLDRALAHSGTELEPGDGVVVRVGARVPTHLAEQRAGIGMSAVEWLRRRDVSIFGGDCCDVVPSRDAVDFPLHDIGSVDIGLVLLDWMAVDRLAAVVQQEGRSDFMLVVAPLRIPGGTGSAVNPLALF